MGIKPLHICFVSPEFPDQRLLPAAGIGFSILNLAKALIEQDHKVTVVVYRQQKSTEFTENDIRIIALSATNNPFYSRFYWRVDLARRVEMLHKIESFDVIEVPDYEGSAAFFKLHLPIIVKLHGSLSYFDFLLKRKPKFTYYFFEKRALQRAKFVTSVSHFAAKITKEVFNLDFNHKVVFNAVAIDGYQQSESALAILYFGSLIEKKGFLELPAIFERIAQEHPHVEFWFAGKDFITGSGKSTKASFFELLQPKFHHRIKDFGMLPAPELKQLLAQASVCIFPSFAEALPMAWLEAMAAGKAIAASNIGWAEELLTHRENALLCHPTDHDTFAKHILDLLESPELRKSYGSKVQQLVHEKFTLEKIAKLHIDLYKQFGKH
ncbi:glycosyltransferase family 4 protein [Flavobacterium aurantiibacter]|uniref:Uncharacterized protein n=1 Tax=Flavobacterium aurantiibacter TaxID=2023067 RepID=A0A255ZRV9_9FLAO|nr:glycosyltransferase family 4 protein [Flavobacterium aurantiibacter]OYQ44248.1 hypothetical protein CHX27_08045 [Flavobacterium aurantiibacter]